MAYTVFRRTHLSHGAQTSDRSHDSGGEITGSFQTEGEAKRAAKKGHAETGDEHVVVHNGEHLFTTEAPTTVKHAT